VDLLILLVLEETEEVSNLSKLLAVVFFFEVPFLVFAELF
jgi:hypothetical protein